MHLVWYILLGKYGLKEVNTKGQDLTHEELIVRLLEDLMFPEEIPLIHVPGHQ
jgi:hypothetical protein